MPKVYLTTNDKKDASMSGVIRMALRKKNLNISRLAVMMGLSVPTMYGRMRQPENFTVKELRRIADILEISAAELGGNV